MKELGIYIHIPFCIKKCDYCDFISYCDKTELVEKYIDSIKNEIQYTINLLTVKNTMKTYQNNLLEKDDYKITSIYIGGGTPSSIDSKYIVDILHTIQKKIEMLPETQSNLTLDNKKNIEITIEVNPGTVTEQKLRDYKNAGINRLSIGLQETNNELLKQIGRIHTYEQFLEAYKLAKKVGFNNINIDLMIGLPNQSIENIKHTLEKILKLNPKHISIYSLILEEGTKLYEKYQNNELELPDEELERNMYWYVKNTLENNGYIHYEISNFAKKEYQSLHNTNCWNQEEYIGFGLSAHSYLKGIRYSNITNMEQYIKNVSMLSIRDINEGCEMNFSKPLINNSYQTIHEIQTKESIKKEYMLLGLRKIEGVSIQKFKNKFRENPIFLFQTELNELVSKKLLRINGDNIILTNKGIDLANKVWEKFI